MQDLSGKVAVVTGGGSGIGRGVALGRTPGPMTNAPPDDEHPARRRGGGSGGAKTPPVKFSEEDFWDYVFPDYLFIIMIDDSSLFPKLSARRVWTPLPPSVTQK